MNDAIDFSAEATYLIDKKRCIQCFACVESCPARALKRIGNMYSLDALEELVLKEVTLIKSLGGGVTFSGGEPAIQSVFIAELSQRLKKGNSLGLGYLRTCILGTLQEIVTLYGFDPFRFERDEPGQTFSIYRYG